MSILRPWAGWGALGLAVALAIVTGLPWPRPEFERFFAVISLAPGVAVAGRWLAQARFDAAPDRKLLGAPSRLSWLAFGLPSLAVWTLSWLAFFPAIMGSDGTDEWNEALGSRRLGDWHTVGHVLTLRLLAKMWQSPASLVFLQLLVLSLLVAWGCRLLRRLGAPLPAVALVAFAIALAPVNWINAITLVKDVPYSCAALALTLLLLQRYQSPDAAARVSFWVAFSLAGVAAMAYRHNGVTVVIGSVVGLLWLGERPSRAFGLGGVTIVLALLLHTLLMRTTGALPQPVGYGMIGLLAAHVKAETPLLPSERAELDALRPISSGWPYNCLSSDPTALDGHLDFDALLAEGLEPVRLAFVLTLRAPRVTLRHLACSSSALRLLASDRAVGGTELTFDAEGEMRSIAPWPVGPPSHSLLPGLRHLLGKITYRSGYPKWDWFCWRPALALYLLIFSVAVGCARRRDWRLAGLVGPVIFNTLGLVAIMPGQLARYQYPVVLAFELFALPFLCLPLREPGDVGALGPT